MIKSFVHEKLKLLLASNRRAGVATQIGFICQDAEELDWAYSHPLLCCEGLFEFKNIVCSLDYANKHVVFHVLVDAKDFGTTRYVGIMHDTAYMFIDDKQNDSTKAWGFAIMDDVSGSLYVLDLLSIDFFPEGKGFVIKCVLDFEDQTF